MTSSTRIGLARVGSVADAMAWLHGEGAARPTGQVLAFAGGFDRRADLGKVKRWSST
jgi:hypothetical protein